MAEDEQNSQLSNASNVAKFLFLRSLLNGGLGQQQAQPQAQSQAPGQLGGLGGLLGLLGGGLLGGQRGQQSGGAFGLARQNFLAGGGQERNVPGRTSFSQGGRLKPMLNPDAFQFVSENVGENEARKAFERGRFFS